MSNWVSAEPELYKGLFDAIMASPLSAKVNHIEDGVKKEAYHLRTQEYTEMQTPYIVIGETDVMEDLTSTSMREPIGVQMHVYADSKFECRELLRLLKYYAKEKIPMEHYEVEKVRLSNQQVMTDVDQYTSHGVLKLNYTVRHHVLYRNEE